MEKLTIKNRKEQNIAVILEEQENAKGLAFIEHGLGGFKEQPHIETFAKSFYEKQFTVVRFDATNSFGESGGDYQDASVTNHCEDLDDVIEWAKTQEWYQEPFYLVGHSLGSISTSLYAERHPQKVKGLVPTSIVVSGKLWEELHDADQMANWEKDGLWNRGESYSKPGAIKILKWAFAEDIRKYDLLENVDKLTMPVLLIVGELDAGTPLKHHQLLFEKLPGEKELHVIKGAEHTFRDKEHLKEIKNIILNWIEKVK